MPNDPWEQDGDVGTEEQTEQKTDKPRMFRVLLHNDNYTTMEFVVFVLMTIFHQSLGDATRIMLAVHREGVGVAGIYPHEIAETKVDKTLKMAREAEYPLQCSMEPE